MPKQKNKNDGTQPRGRVILYTVAALLALAGLADSTFLTVAYLTGEMDVCGGSTGCSKVLGSAYARIGGVPIAIFGAIAYYSAFGLATFAAFGHVRARKFFVPMVWSIFAVTLWLLYVQAFVLHAFCHFCVLSAAIAFLLAGLVVASPPPRQEVA